MTARSITILRSRNNIPLTKVLRPSSGGAIEVRKAQQEKYFYVDVRQIETIIDLASTLQDLEKKPNCTVIRGEPIIDLKDEIVTRTMRQTAFQEAFFREEPRSWVMLDVDNVEIPSELQPCELNLAKIVEYTIGLLPTEFQGVDCYYQFSASMGVKKNFIKVHIWFLLDASVSNSFLRKWLGDSPVDTAVFNPVQPHYTASPIFEGTLKDPLPFRSGILQQGSETEIVRVPQDLVSHSGTTKTKRSGGSEGYCSARHEIVRDPSSGKVVDGRERHLFLCSIDSTKQLIANDEGNVAQEDLLAKTWQMFSESTDLSDGKWTVDNAAREVRRRIEELESGSFFNPGRDQKTTLLPSAGPYFPLSSVDKDEGDAALEHSLKKFFRPSFEITRLALRVTMGAGKTRKMLEELCANLSCNIGQIVELYVPDHKLAKEYSDTLAQLEVNAAVVHVHPRTGGAKKQFSPMCKRTPYVESLEQAGIPVYSNACETSIEEDGVSSRCIHFDDCPYLEQFRKADPLGNKILILVKNHLFLPRNKVQSEPNIVVVDESFVIDSVEEFSLIRPDVTAKLKHFGFDDFLRAITEWIEENKPLLRALRENQVNNDALVDIRTQLHHHGCKFDPTCDRPISIVSDNVGAFIAKMVDILLEELRYTARDDVTRITFDHDNDLLSVVKCREVNIPETSSLLILDATADQLLLEKVVGPLEFSRIDIEQRCFITQVWDRTGSKWFWENSTSAVDDLVAVLNSWADIGERPLLVCHKALADQLRDDTRMHSSVHIMHFGYLRGSNEAKDCTVAFITGRNQPPAKAIDRKARGLFWNDSIALQHDFSALNGDRLPEDLRGYTIRDENGLRNCGVMVPSFSDRRIEIVHQQVREAESIQALARLRLVHCDSIKQVFLLSNLPIEIPIDRHIQFSQLMPDILERELLERGNLPLSPLGLSKMRPDISKGSEADKKMLQRSSVKDAQKLGAMPPMVAAGRIVLKFRAKNAGRTRAHEHLFVIGGKLSAPIPDFAMVGTRFRSGQLPLDQWVQYLEEGDPDIPGSGWGEISNVQLEWL